MFPNIFLAAIPVSVELNNTVEPKFHGRCPKKRISVPLNPKNSLSELQIPGQAVPQRNMKVMGYSSITRPSGFLVQLELPFLPFRKANLISTPTLHTPPRGLSKRLIFIPKLQYSVAARSGTYSPIDFKASKGKSKSIKMADDQESTSSLYARPSLLEMKKQRMENRARVYEFLRGIGVVPDELDGLELPVTVDVMKERVDFLQKLGLTIEDINNYPLVLGCSVKKNMIPVLDYLGKLGVRKTSLTDFLRRYPQVLHSSVVVDLKPVVQYLQGLDIKAVHIPRVLEKYPEVLGFKLEGTMSTSVAYLIGIGVGRREIGGVLTTYPEILGMRVGRFIKPFVDYLESLGIPRLALARLIEIRPHILGFRLEETVKPNVNALLEFEVREAMLPSIIAQYPEIIGIDLKLKLSKQMEFFSSVLGLGREEFGRMIEKMPQVVSINSTATLKHIEFLKDCGFSSDHVRKMVVGCPPLLALNLNIMKQSFEYFQTEMGRPLEDLVAFPAFFTYGLESMIKPRYKTVSKRGLKCSLAWLLNCSDDKFEDRMSYDSIDLEEMEPESVFDMDSIMGPRNDGSSSEYEDEDSDDEDL